MAYCASVFNAGTNDMTILRALIISISFGLLSCNNNMISGTVKNEHAQISSVAIGTLSKPEQNTTGGVSDTFKQLVVDDYPVTNAMLADNAGHKMQSGQTYSYDKVWFGNDTIKQTLVLELYTDYYRMVIYHFYNNDIPVDLINRMELHSGDGELMPGKQKSRDFRGFLKQAIKINSSYFTSDKGFRLGNPKRKAIGIYGSPDKQSMSNGLETLEWAFPGDTDYDGKTNLKRKPLTKDGFGHQVVMYFRNGKLIGQILQNDIP